MLLSNIKKIAVLRANRLGDLIFILPALDALKKIYPEAEIVLLGTPWHSEFLKNRPGPVDRVIIIPPTEGIYSLQTTPESDNQSLENFFSQMKQESFDLAIQLHGGGRYSNPFVNSLGAKITLGSKTIDAEGLDLEVPYIYWQPEILRYLEIVSLVEARTDQLSPKIFVTEQDVEESLSVVPKSDHPLVIIHPGASDERRRWPIDKFASVGDELAKRGYRILVTGTEDESLITSKLTKYMSEPATSLVGQLSLGGLSGLISRTSLVISNDTGPLHLAAAIGKPTVGIFWCGNFINGGPITVSTHRSIISWRLECPDCGVSFQQPRCEHNSSWIDEAPFEEVLEQSLELLNLN